MAPSCYDVAASMLLCAEDNSSILWLEEEEEEEEEKTVVGRKRGGRSSPDWDDGFGGADLFPPQSEECVAGLVEREPEHMPRSDYGERLRRGGVDLCVRREAVDWIWKVHAYYGFGPLTACLAVNYLDRFLSHYELPEGKAWMTQLLSVACLSLAAKMEETAVPQSLDLQVGDAAVTPFSYLDYFLQKLNGGNAAPRSWLFQSAELILGAARGTGYIGFRPSEIAAAVAVTVVGDADAAVDIVKACAHVDKERVLRCQDAIQSMASSINTVPPKRAGGGRASPVPQSPVGVLDAGCMSYKSDDDAAAAAATVASHGASASSVTSKRRKISR
ncbi:hypothetical protein PR202_ga21285 [Eleusine coracana subsp. coracana]|uniref:Cyclin N-terminal domain-containing protein n=1 Tax=Eleusine coracana subsp. coracana TaxID=191504 RepID=A0AAV5D184_ELECO|nr:hypothetical protein PR202_ga21285 [Eleusine coracana subsp. coracana]